MYRISTYLFQIQSLKILHQLVIDKYFFYTYKLVRRQPFERDIFQSITR